MQLTHSSKVRNAVNKASCIFGASSDSVRSIQKYFGRQAILMNESGCELTDMNIQHDFENKEYLDLLWVGRFIFTKQLELAIKSVVTANNEKLRLHIVGGSKEEEEQYKKVADAFGANHLCVWHGKVSHNEVQTLMQKSDVFFFTSIAEGTPHVILEAIANGLPIVCFNTCGHGDVVNAQVGRKIELTTPSQSSLVFAKILNELESHRELLKKMSDNCKQRQSELTWEEKAKTMVGCYEKIALQK